MNGTTSAARHTQKCSGKQVFGATKGTLSSVKPTDFNLGFSLCRSRILICLLSVIFRLDLAVHLASW